MARPAPATCRPRHVIGNPSLAAQPKDDIQEITPEDRKAIQKLRESREHDRPFYFNFPPFVSSGGTYIFPCERVHIPAKERFFTRG